MQEVPELVEQTLQGFDGALAIDLLEPRLPGQDVLELAVGRSLLQTFEHNRSFVIDLIRDVQKLVYQVEVKFN